MRIRTLVVLGVAGVAASYFFDPQHGRARRARARNAIQSLMGRRAGPVDLEPLPENVAPSPSESSAPPEPRAPVEMKPREEPAEMTRSEPLAPIAAEDPVEPIAAEESREPIEMPASSVEHVSIPEADETVPIPGEEPAASTRPDEPIAIPDEQLRVIKEWTPRRPIETSEPERPTTTPHREAPIATTTTESAVTSTEPDVTTSEAEEPIAFPGSGATDRVSKESPEASDDQQIRSRVRTSLTERRDLGAEDVVVDVSNGVVYLAGGLRDPQTFGEVLDVTRNVPGVRRVQSLLHVPGSERIMKTIAGGPRPDRENGGGSPLQ
jgi:hypothetical protein